jgi:hypothetical protein
MALEPRETENKPGSMYSEEWYNSIGDRESQASATGISTDTINSKSAKPDEINRAENNAAQTSDSVGGGYRPGDKSKRKGFSNKKKAALVGGAASAVATVVVIMFGLFGDGLGFRSLDQLVTAYRFGSYHRQISRRIGTIVAAQGILAPDSPRFNSYQQTRLSRTFTGWSPENAMKALGDADLEFRTQSNRFGRTRITAVIDKSKPRGSPDRVISIDNASSRGAFVNQVTDLVSSKMSENGHKKMFRRQTVNFVRSNTGIRYAKFRAFLADRSQRYTFQESKALNATEKLADGTQGRFPLAVTGINEVQNQVDEGRANINDGKPPKRGASLGSARTNYARSLQRFSDGAFIATVGCIALDVSKQTEYLIVNRIEAPMRMAADLRTRADQASIGEVTDDAMAAELDDWADSGASAAYQRMIGTPDELINDEARLNEASYPFTFFGLPLSWLLTLSKIINTTFDPYNVLVSLPESEQPQDEELLSALEGSNNLNETASAKGLCSGILNPAVQTSIALVELVGLIFSLGGLKAATTTVTSFFKVIVKAGTGLGLYYVLFEKILPAYVDALAGFDGMALPGQGAENFNRVDLGMLLLKNNVAARSGGVLQDPQQAAAEQAAYMAEYRQREREKGFMYAYLSPSTPFSITSRVAFMSSQGIQSGMRQIASSLLYSLNPFNLVADSVKASTGTVYPVEDEFYGTQEWQYAFPDEFDHIDNSIYVDENFEDLREQYAACVSLPMADRIIGNVDTESERFNRDDCDSEDARRFNQYYADCTIFDQVAREGTGQDSFNSRACEFILGATNPIEEVIGGSGPRPPGVDSVETPSFAAIPSIKIDDPPPTPHSTSNCTGGFTVGSQSLSTYISGRWSPPVTSIGGYDCRPMVCGSGSCPTSVHGLGRALDIMVDGTTPNGLQTGDQIRNWLYHNAERLGIQRIIWNRGIWQANRDGWNTYTGPYPHTDHLHIEVNLRASQDANLAGGL